MGPTAQRVRKERLEPGHWFLRREEMVWNQLRIEPGPVIRICLLRIPRDPANNSVVSELSILGVGRRLIMI